MYNRKIGWRVVLAAGVATAVVVGLNPPIALADTGQPPLVPAGLRNSSDPHVEGCYTFENGVQHDYWCLYTSNDMELEPRPFFAMGSTYVYTYDPASGLNPADPTSWVDHTHPGNTNLVVPAFNESQLPFAPGNTQHHLWAPTAHYGLNSKETLLYVPDIYGGDRKIPGIAADDDVSYIAVATSLDGGTNPGSNPWGPFSYKKAITWGGSDITDSYMSDPAVATIAWSHPIIDENWRDPKTNRYPCRENWVYCHTTKDEATWLLWANGDNSSCGDLSIGMLRDTDLTDLVDIPNKQFSEIYVNGIAAELGSCDAAGTHPYLEGPELYDLTQVNVPLPTNPQTGQSEPYALFFAAKPNGGTYGNRNQVLAWASASTVRGPYTYRGVLMDSSTTSWTNHGSILARSSTNWITGASETQFIVFFHDEGDPATFPPPHAHHRMVRAACLPYSRGLAGGISPGHPGFAKASRTDFMPDLNRCISMNN